MTSAMYFDGQSPRMHAVDVALGNGVFALAGGAIVKSYPYHEARMAEPFANAPCIVDFADGGRCELHDPAGKAAVTSALGFRPSAVMRWQRHWYGALLAIVLLIGSLYSFVEWGAPALAERVVAALPVSLDKRVGDEAQRSLQKTMFADSKLSKDRIAEVEAIFKEVVPAKTRMPLTLTVVDMPGYAANALALPNGAIMINDAMILQITGKDDEISGTQHDAIAGILAHEIGHIEGRHSMRAIARASMLALASATLFGDFSAVVAGAPVVLLNMDYSRNMETEADEYAIRRMRDTEHSTLGLANLFESLDEELAGVNSLPKWMTKQMGYMSSHPPSKERSARFRAASPPEEEPEETIEE